MKKVFAGLIAVCLLLTGCKINPNVITEEKYWNFVTDLLCEMTERADQDYSYYVEANDL